MSPPPPTLDDATLSAVRESLGSYARESDSGAVLGDAMRALASDAKAKGISAASLLIVLKNLLSSLPELRHITEPAERDRLKQRVITACIEQYYQK